MRYDDVYALTPQGEQQLRGGKTTVTPEELDLLVRVDGILTLAQIHAGMGAGAPRDFDTLFQGLLAKRLVQPSLGNPLADQFNFTPSHKAVAEATAQADAAAASMQKTGYFVRIARRNTARTLSAATGMTAVVVEDEAHLAKFLQHYLTFEGFQVRTAGNRAEIVAALTSRPLPDLVLLDVVLPDADGFDVLAKLRGHPAFKDVPVIMLTGKATRESVIRGLAGGADGYVTKPFEADALLEAVRTVTGLPDESAEPGQAGPFTLKPPR